MRKAVALLGLVLIPMGFGGSALAREGRDSSGQFGYALECVTGGGVSEPLFINQSLNSGAITVQDGAGNTQFVLQGFDNSGRYDWDGGWQVIYDDGGGFQILDAGTETPAEVCGGTTPTTTAPQTTQPNSPSPDESPLLISECRGADWYLVNPDVDGVAYTFAYRIGFPINGVLYDPDYVSNNPNNALYGEVLVPAGTNEVGYADDFNVQHTATRPEACGGPTTPTEPTTPTTPTTGPSGSVIRNIGVARGSGFVAAGAEIGPGSATFGVTGFAAGEQITVTLHSTPRALGTVTADASGVASITFEVLAADGAGEHRVEFSGPSGTFSVPFTLVLPEQSLPVTR